MAVNKKTGNETPKRTSSRSSTRSDSNTKKTGARSRSRPPARKSAAVRKPTSARKAAINSAGKSTPAANSSRSRPSVAEHKPGDEDASRKALDNTAADRNLSHTGTSAKDMTRQLYDRVGKVARSAAATSSETVTKARQGTRRTAHTLIRSAIKFLENVEGRIKEKPASNTNARKRTAKKTGKSAAAKPKANAKKPASKPKTKPAAAAGK